MSKDFTREFNDLERALDRLEPAWADFAYSMRRDNDRIMRDTASRTMHLCSTLIEVHEEMEGHRARFAAGHPEALLQALALALNENLPVPYWVSVQVRERLGRVMGLKDTNPLSLHDAFELEPVIPTTSKRYMKARRDLQHEWRLYKEVDRATHTGMSFDAALKLVLKTKVRGLGKTAARTLYHRRKELETALLPKKQRLHKSR